MELTEEQKLLIKLFKQLEMSENLIIATMLAIQDPEQINKLLDYIIEQYDKGKKLDKDEIVKKALEISQE